MTCIFLASSPCSAHPRDPSRWWRGTDEPATGHGRVPIATDRTAAEAIGVAMAMSEAGLPYVVSPILDARGRLLDGTPMVGVVARIDEVVTPRPVCYTVSCVHPSVLRQALRADEGLGRLAGRRLLGIKANASRKSPEELVELDEVDSEDPERLADEVVDLQAEFGLRVLGGCCGTDHRYIEALADRRAVGRK